MRYAVIGGGPSGLYFALLAKKANPSDEVLVVERNPPDATFGWGVVFSEETLGALRDADYDTYTEIGESFARWNAIDIYYRDTMVRSRGHVFTGISRKLLLNILQRRCRALGVRLEFEREVRDVAELEGADLIVGADGINGLVRRAYGEFFKPQIATHPTKYVWFGSDLPLDAFTFIFRRNDDGLFQVHAYPFDARTCTFIVECPEDAWRRAGLESASEAQSIAYCEALFQPELRGRRLMSNRSLWVNFLTLRQESWHHGKVVLLGDAAHTAHFSIGSGTKLAMEDSIALVDALRRHEDLGAALNDYEMERQPIVERFQEAALESSSYFEHVSRYAQFDPRQFAFNLLTRSRRITYINLTQRDPDLVRTVDSWFAAAATGSPDGAVRLSPPPMFTPLRIRRRRFPGGGPGDHRVCQRDRGRAHHARDAGYRSSTAGNAAAGRGADPPDWKSRGVATRSRRPPGIDAAALARCRPTAQRGWVATHGGVADRLHAALGPAERDDDARHLTRRQGFCRGGAGGGGRLVRCPRAQLCSRIFAHWRIACDSRSRSSMRYGRAGSVPCSFAFPPAIGLTVAWTSMSRWLSRRC
ncbi:MAG: hypothetical protein E6J07_09425 [Chloroflexi bacterium]|nr:MAG: hypothetical protein E6J07_09425 [Chloroflexota bacterium]